MQIDGVTVTYLSEWDGLPVKNHLPAELQDRLKTENQWLEAGYVLKAGARKYELHPSALAKRLCAYYLDVDVEPVAPASDPQSCMTCQRRAGRHCVVAGGFVGANQRCSEWTPRDT